ncbi:MULTISPECIES: SDR family oxidoreductase [unclassified Plantactinospora]|uniref:SDR family oxidoreductase n=1 Tax=unclassified Plantactinospora TaxID=2631981 RepID=UPI000D153576|nr:MULTISPECIES: SDR family oxidoreductase [unclassified Plantactinospora]AVT28743.1 oxidoreductase [Plantactinospora sp. BC1]AVT35144.1 oxidoreductase [Plantactinospora sp. BB1]
MTPLTVVTGGGRGIGAATVRQLAAAGHDVVFCYRRDADAADAVLRDVTAAGRRGLAVRADTTDPDQVVRLFDEAAKLGEPTGLVNNAGVTSPIGPFEELTVTDLRRVVDVNLIGYILCAQQAARRFPSGAAIVNVSSAAATLGSPGEYVHYAAVKAATDTLTVGLAKELAPRGIRVNAVSPGTIDTEIHIISGVPDRAQRVAGRIPLGRAGRADEVAAAIVWLLGDGASYTTGAVLRVAGGM